MDSSPDDDDVYNSFDIDMDGDTDPLFYRTPRTSRRTNERSMTPITARLKTPFQADRFGSAGFRSRTALSGTAGSLRPGTGRPRPTTTKIEEKGEGMGRPLTAIQSAGYIDPRKPKPVELLQKVDDSEEPVKFELDDTPERRIEKLESKIWQLLDDSALAGCAGKKKEALELAKEAQHQETILVKEEDEIGDTGHDYDISLSVLLNLAIQHEGSEMYKEALSNYESIFTVKYPSKGFRRMKLRLNMGNIYMKLKQPNKALKVYRMTLDEIGDRDTWLRMKLMHNTGLVFLQVGKLDEAATYFENVMRERPSFKVGFHLIVANYMANDAFSAKRNFQELLEISLNADEERQDKPDDDPVVQLLADVLKNDPLSKYQQEKRTYAERCIITSGRLIAPMLEDNALSGYDWVIEAVRNSKYSSLYQPLNISKAVALIKKGDTKEAIEIFLQFEKETSKYLPVAATNLSFIYYLKGQIDAALKYGNMAIDQDTYNSAAYVNVGNCLATSGNIERASVIYNKGVDQDSSLVEGKYNLGLVNLEMRDFDQAEFFFNKVLELTPNNADAMFQIGRTQEAKGDREEAVDSYLKVLAIHPHDAGVLKSIARNFDAMGDKRQAHTYYADCFKYNPSDVEVIKWLTVYLTEQKLPDQAVKYYERGLLLEPNDPVWRLSIAKCHRESGNPAKAIEVYQSVLRMFPDNLKAIEQLEQLYREADDENGSRTYTEMRLRLQPKLEIEYDPSKLVFTPRPKVFRRMLPEEVLSRHLKSMKTAPVEPPEEKPMTKLPFLVKLPEPEENLLAPLMSSRLGTARAGNNDDRTALLRRAFMDTPRNEEEDPDTEYRNAVARRRRGQGQGQGDAPPPSARASTARIRMARDCLFDDVALPDF